MAWGATATLSMSAMSAADTMRGGRSSQALFLLRPLDHPLDQLRLDSPAKPPPGTIVA